MKRILLFTLIILCFLLPACGDDGVSIPTDKTYYDTFKVKGLAINAEVNLTNAPTFTEISELILADSNGVKLDLCDEYIAKKASQSFPKKSWTFLLKSRHDTEEAA